MTLSRPSRTKCRQALLGHSIPAWLKWGSEFGRINLFCYTAMCCCENPGNHRNSTGDSGTAFREQKEDVMIIHGMFATFFRHRQVTDLDVGFQGPGCRSVRQLFCGDATRLFLDHFSKHLSSVLGVDRALTRGPDSRAPKTQIIRNENHHLALLKCCDIFRHIMTNSVVFFFPGHKIGFFKT